MHCGCCDHYDYDYGYELSVLNLHSGEYCWHCAPCWSPLLVVSLTAVEFGMLSERSTKLLSPAPVNLQILPSTSLPGYMMMAFWIAASLWRTDCLDLCLLFPTVEIPAHSSKGNTSHLKIHGIDNKRKLTMSSASACKYIKWLESNIETLQATSRQVILQSSTHTVQGKLISSLIWRPI